MKTSARDILYMCFLPGKGLAAKNTVKLFVFIFIFTNGINAQHYQFSQFYAAPTYLNPAFTGANACSRLSLSYRDQWPSIPGAFISYQLSYDHYFNSMRSGLGFLFFSDKSGYGGLRTNQYSFLYAFELKLSKKYFCRFGVQPGFVSRSVNYSALLFGDQIARGGASASVESFIPSTVYLDLSSGLLLYSKQNWLGLAAYHMTQPNQALLDISTSPLPREFRIHGGRKFYIKEEAKKADKEYISVAFNYKSQLKFDQFDVGVYYTRKPLVAGVWYRGIPVLKAYKPGYSNNDALCFLFGINWLKLNVGYSYDLTISKLTYKSGGSHELSLRYDFCDRKRYKVKGKTILVPCPKF